MRRLDRLTCFVALALVCTPTFADSPSLTDENIEAAVMAALTPDEKLPGSAGLKVRCDVGILTLGGTADTLYTLDQAVRQAGAVPGVVDVVVDATVPRSRIPDTEILAEVQKAMQVPSFSFVSIQATVGGGRVTLSGTAGSYAQKLLAEREISKIAGVTGIQNRIVVKAETNVSETGLSRLVFSRLTAGGSPVAGKFDVSIRGNVAILTGRVPLFLNRLEATEAALGVPGIQEVDNRLVVDPSRVTSPPETTQPPPNLPQTQAN